MAPRKDQMRIIRQDAGFSAKLGFGGMVAPPAEAHRPSMAPLSSVNVMSGVKPEEPLTGAASTHVIPQHDDGGLPIYGQEEARKEEGEPQTPPHLAQRHAVPAPSATARGQVVYVAVSLTARQACLAEAWAAVARCSVQFLIRRVAQGLRDQLFDDWERDGMPEVSEPRGARGKHPTSVTLTLRPPFAADLAARHDPLGILGLARVMGPAFRARFQEAFDLALDKAPLHTTPEGEEK
ncbi:hypothetical protein D2N39_21845 [Gemmobacter lutimaris]|uniref:Uncharacterized protein n=3 Tax=Gemmobacter TaxID=204456 RepID=A0A398BH06_9RHOB|nr:MULTISPECIES: hypothetical protein [Gemmobacter]PTX47271.1 hypothetical protein C8N34_11327 [Gemmobacter caeni]RID89705.1 hypothetical protein D2N39_21845 [Gemmobacter lutimaris]TWI96510.1 hypothetical protein IQ03_03388 [Gemmobacter caeni]